MNILIITLIAIALISLATSLLLWRSLNQRRTQDQNEQSNQLRQEVNILKESLQQQIGQLTQQMHMQIEGQARFMQESKGYQETVGHVENKLGQLHQATQKMVDIGKDISSLQDILQVPKLRGGLGELLLEELLRQILPEDHFSIQYVFGNGRQVDAVVHLCDGMIPVDAKFPLENFQRILAAENEDDRVKSKKQFATDVKKHIDHIAEKYILPLEGTFEFALMYIPAENVYYETIIQDEHQKNSISDYALNKKVIPVSPNSFYAYLQAIVRGLKGLRIEKSAQLILKSLGQLEADFKRCFVDFEKMGGHLGHAQASYEKVSRRFERLQDKLQSIESTGAEIESSSRTSLTSKTDSVSKEVD